MSIWVTGDLHGNPYRLSSDSFYEQKEFEDGYENNTVIQLGDFGLIWRNKESPEEKHKLDWLNKKNFTTVFVDGNHDNIPRLETYSVKEWNGGLVNVIRPHVLRLRRGEIYTIEGKKFFSFGGASSQDIQDGIIDYHDKDWKEQVKRLEKQGKCMYRVKGLTWWEEELPSEEEMKNGLENLWRENNRVDYIITHSPSTSELYLMGGKGLYRPDILTNYLEEIKATVEYKKHFFAHMHLNKAVNDKDICLYEQIIRIE